MGKIRAFITHVLAFFKPQPEKFQPIMGTEEKFTLVDYVFFGQIAPALVISIVEMDRFKDDPNVIASFNSMMEKVKRKPAIYNEVLRLAEVERQARKNDEIKKKAMAEYKEPTETIDDLNKTSTQMNEVISKMMGVTKK